MKTTIETRIFRLITIVLLIGILVTLIFILIGVNKSCQNDKDIFSNIANNIAPKQTTLVLCTAQTYDSINDRFGTMVWIDTLVVGQKGNTFTTIWSNCPNEYTKVAKKKVRLYYKKDTKLNEVKMDTFIPKNEIQSVPIAKIIDSSNEDALNNNVVLNVQSLPVVPNDTLKMELRNNSDLLYKNVSVLPNKFDGTNKTESNFDLVIPAPDLHLNDQAIKKAKKHLWAGTGLATASAVAFASTMFVDVPTFVEYNSLGNFDPANKYYDHNVKQRDRLNTLKWVRGVSIGVGVLGGAEIVHGILLLKNANAKIDIAPQKITLKYSF